MRHSDAIVVTLAVLAVATMAGTASATGNAPPLADAGLDQRVTPDTTVYLDANESRDPDGEITSVEWAIETPGGNSITPDCNSCRQTEFNADEMGQYNVTLSVTDDGGATRSDTLYVIVAESEAPSVTLSGPGLTVRNSETEYTATVESDDAALQSLAWVIDGDVVDQRELSGSNATVSSTQSFAETGDVSIRAVAYDTLGYRGADERMVTVGTPTNNGGGGRLPSCPSNKGGPQFDANGNRDGCYDGADRILSADGETYLQDVNGAEGLQLRGPDGGLIDVGSIQNNENINANGKLIGYTGEQDMNQFVANGNDEVTLPKNKKNEQDKSKDNDDGPDDDGPTGDTGVNARLLDGSTDTAPDDDSGSNARKLDGSTTSGGDSGGSDDSGGGGGIVDTITNVFLAAVAEATTVDSSNGLLVFFTTHFSRPQIVPGFIDQYKKTTGRTQKEIKK